MNRAYELLSTVCFALQMSITLELIEKVSKSVTRSVRVGSLAVSSTDSPMLHAEEVKGIRLAVR